VRYINHQYAVPKSEIVPPAGAVYGAALQFFLGAGRFALSQALNFRLRLQRASSLDACMKKLALKPSPAPRRPTA
jgi:hypothetical protein